MKKLILAFITVAFVGLGSAPASAAPPDEYKPKPGVSVPVECADNETITQECLEFYTEIAPPTTPAPATTTTTTLAPLAPDLPKTGSGVSPILSIGALLVLGGGLVVVVARRRSTSTSPAT